MAALPSASSETWAPPPVSSIDRLGRVARPRVDRVRRAERAGELERLGVDVDRHHGGAERAGDHHRRQADAAAAVDRDPVAGADAAVLDDAANAVMKRQPSDRGLDEAERVRQADEVEVGARERDQLGERAPGGEAGLEVARRRSASGRGGTARSVPQPQQNGTVTRSPTAKPRTSGPTAATSPASSWPGTCGQRDRRVVAHPAVPVAAADAGRAHRDHDAVGRRLRVRHVSTTERLAERAHHRGSHRATVTSVTVNNSQ